MKLIVAGSRDFDNYDFVSYRVKSWIEDWITDHGGTDVEIVSGGATGVDTLADRFSIRGEYIFKRYPAQWIRYGNPAGPVRNRQMAEYADALIAFRSSSSKGTRDMIRVAENLGLDVKIIDI